MQTSSQTFTPGQSYRLFIDGQWVESEQQVEIRFPYDRHILVGRVAWATQAHVDKALEAAQRGAKTIAAWPLHRRAALLQRVADLITAHTNYFASLIVHEVGKPLKDAHLEIARAIAAIRLAAEEATRIHGEMVPSVAH